MYLFSLHLIKKKKESLVLTKPNDARFKEIFRMCNFNLKLILMLTVTI